MKESKLSYAEAIARLQDIVSQIDKGEMEIDQLAEKMKEANELIAFCTSKLSKVEAEVEKLSDVAQQTE